MKGLLSVMLCIVVAGCGGTPDFTDVEGEGHRYKDFEDRWVVVNYWATWCGPCIKEIPELNTLAATHSDRIVVLGVNWDAPEGEAALAQARKMKIEFPVYTAEPAARLKIEKPDVLPTTFVFAPGMVLRETMLGPQTEASILAVIDGNGGAP